MLPSRSLLLRQPRGARMRGRSSSTNVIPPPSHWKRVWEWYSHRLDTHPLLTKAVTSGLLAAAGDLLCQAMLLKQNQSNHHRHNNNTDARIWKSTEQQQNVSQQRGSHSADTNGVQGKWNDSKIHPPHHHYLNWKQTARFAFIGACYNAPVRHYYLNWLARIAPGGSVRAVAARVVGERVILAPLSLSVWLTAMWTLEYHVTGERREVTSGCPVHHGLGSLRHKLMAVYPELLVASWSLWIPLMAVNFRLVPVKYQVLYMNVFQLLWNAYLSWKGASSTIETAGVVVRTTTRAKRTIGNPTTTNLAEQESSLGQEAVMRRSSDTGQGHDTNSFDSHWELIEPVA